MYVPRSNFVCFFPISKPWHDTRLISLISRSAVLKSFEWKLFQIKFYSGKPQRNKWIGFITCMYGCNILPGGNRVQHTFCRVYWAHMASQMSHKWLHLKLLQNKSNYQISGRQIFWSTCCFRWGGRAVEKIQSHSKSQRQTDFDFGVSPLEAQCPMYFMIHWPIEKKRHHQCGTTGRT
jgi:hypothetical protein